MLKWITLFILVMTCFSKANAQTVKGKASWYGYSESSHRRTANGDLFKNNGMTCAATNVFKLGDSVRVTNQTNGKSVVLKINDRGNFGRMSRVLDLSKGAFAKIADISGGVIQVLVEKIN